MYTSTVHSAPSEDGVPSVALGDFGEVGWAMHVVAGEQFLTIEDVARRLAISRRTVRRWVTQGKLAGPVRFSARCHRWRASDLQRWLEERSVTGY